MAYHRAHGVNTHIVRIFNTYGMRMRLDDGRVLPNFMGQALRGEPAHDLRRRLSRREAFVTSIDLVEGIYRLLSKDYALPVNLGNPSEITIKQFADEILKHTGSQSSIVYRPLPPDDPKQRKPDITLARNLLGWEPKVGREEGLKLTLDYFRTKV